MSILRAVRRAAWALAAITLFSAGAVALRWFQVERLGIGRDEPGIASTGMSAVGGPFSLVSHRGERVTRDTFKGKPTAYFFGFTHCPEVCPATLFGMTQHLEELGSDAGKLNVVFVTVDPERDTPELLRTYLESFDPRIEALTGPPEELAAAAKAFRITYRKVPVEGGYTMDHTASVIVTDAKGELAALIDYHEDAATGLAKLKRAVRDHT